MVETDRLMQTPDHIKYQFSYIHSFIFGLGDGVDQAPNSEPSAW
jgi:hypothetical protein